MDRTRLVMQVHRYDEGITTAVMSTTQLVRAVDVNYDCFTIVFATEMNLFYWLPI